MIRRGFVTVLIMATYCCMVSWVETPSSRCDIQRHHKHSPHRQTNGHSLRRFCHSLIGWSVSFWTFLGRFNSWCGSLFFSSSFGGPFAQNASADIQDHYISVRLSQLLMFQLAFSGTWSWCRCFSALGNGIEVADQPIEDEKSCLNDYSKSEGQTNSLKSHRIALHQDI